MTFDGITQHDSESGYDEKKVDDSMPQYVDAFGDESNAEVKYKTMEWWYVMRVSKCMFNISLIIEVLGKPECVCQYRELGPGLNLT